MDMNYGNTNETKKKKPKLDNIITKFGGVLKERSNILHEIKKSGTLIHTIN